MTFITAFIGIVVVVLCVVAIEKKRGDGPLTYPLWRGNLFLPWGALVLLFMVVIGGLNLPRAVALAERGVEVQAVVTEQEAHCQTSYGFKVGAKDYTGLDSRCGVKPGMTLKAYYDPQSPEDSTLSLPREELKEELIAMVVISLSLATVILLWLVMTYVIGRRQKT